GRAGGDGLGPAADRLRRGGGRRDPARRRPPPPREAAGGGGGAARPRRDRPRAAPGRPRHAGEGPGRGAGHRLLGPPAGAADSGPLPLRIDQWVPALHWGDAIGDSARLMRDAFRAWGHAADVYPSTWTRTSRATECRSRGGRPAAPATS